MGSRRTDRATRAMPAAIAAGVLLLAASFGATGADIIRGADLYRTHCVSCHGANGVSTWPGAPNIARREGMMQPDMALLQRLRTGKGAKPGFQGLMSDQDILNVIAYSRTLMR